jgi:hypothetical protein
MLIGRSPRALPRVAGCVGLTLFFLLMLWLLDLTWADTIKLALIWRFWLIFLLSMQSSLVEI